MKKESEIPCIFQPPAPPRGPYFRSWIGFLLLPLAIFVVLYGLRSFFFHPWCAVNPSPCTLDSVNKFDRIAFSYGSMRADFWSNVLQNLVGVLAFTLPWAWYWGKERVRALQETFLLMNISFWNLALMELIRTLVQRPRPVVYHSPLTEGANIHQYTSFYSGHTSFTALACLGLFFIASRRFGGSERTAARTNQWVYFCVLGFYLLSTFGMGLLRVWGGRHFPSDVIFGAAAGSAIALFFNGMTSFNCKK